MKLSITPNVLCILLGMSFKGADATKTIRGSATKTIRGSGFDGSEKALQDDIRGLLGSSCLDVPNWYDSDGEYFDCDWYASYQSACQYYGNDYENFGHTANTACCACGGGTAPFVHVPNTYCQYYDQGGDGDCTDGKSFSDVWSQCEEDGSDICMGVMWNSCEGPTSDTTVNGAWKLMTAGQEVGDADHPTDTCGGKDQALGHWDVFVHAGVTATAPLIRHVPNTYCEYYDQGGDGDCTDGKSFSDVWRQCKEDGSDICMGVMWNSCEGPTSDTTVNGAWKLMTAGQEVGDADHPTNTCGGKDQALGHWDVFVHAGVGSLNPACVECLESSCPEIVFAEWETCAACLIDCLF